MCSRVPGSVPLFLEKEERWKKKNESLNEKEKKRRWVV
jgi:hypothetical protein